MPLPIGPDIGSAAFVEPAADAGASALTSWGAPAALVALMLGGKYLGNMGSMFGDKDMWQTERNRAVQLARSGVKIPAPLQQNLASIQRGRSKDELIQQAEKDATDTTFYKTGNIMDFDPNAAAGFSAFAEKFGNDWWDKLTSPQRYGIAKLARDSGAFNYHHGTLDIDWNKVDPAAIQNILTGKTQITQLFKGSDGKEYLTDPRHDPNAKTADGSQGSARVAGSQPTQQGMSNLPQQLPQGEVDKFAAIMQKIRSAGNGFQGLQQRSNPASGMASSFLNNLMAQNTRPIAFPTPFENGSAVGPSPTASAPKQSGNEFNATLNRLIGG